MIVPISQMMEINIEPSNRIFEELGNNSYDFLDVISELIDNSISAHTRDSILNIDIVIGLSKQPNKAYFKISDTASGIEAEKLAFALSPAATSGGMTLNEHGLGLKQAVASLGEIDYIITKTKQAKQAIRVESLRFGRIPVLYNDVAWEQGTEICVKNLKNIIPTKHSTITKITVPALGARYRRFLRVDNPRLTLTLHMCDIDGLIPKLIKSWDVSEVKPVYFHPNIRQNKPIVFKEQFKGKGWQAELTFGYAPTHHEYEEMGLDVVMNYDPYHVTLNNQGLDIFKNDRIIKFHQLSELGITPVRHNSFNHIRGEINLINGFTTSITKNHIVHDRHFNELLVQIREFVKEKNLVNRKHYAKVLSEALLRDRLAKVMKENTFFARENIQTEYAIGGLGGYADIRTDTDVWELKIKPACGLDIYQLFAYMDMGNISSGYLVAPEFKTSAISAAEHIRTKHGVYLELVSLSNLPINNAPNMEELKNYY